MLTKSTNETTFKLPLIEGCGGALMVSVSMVTFVNLKYRVQDGNKNVQHETNDKVSRRFSVHV